MYIRFFSFSFCAAISTKRATPSAFSAVEMDHYYSCVKLILLLETTMEPLTSPLTLVSVRVSSFPLMGPGKEAVRHPTGLVLLHVSPSKRSSSLT